MLKPNRSIERTAAGKPVEAAHVERLASRPTRLILHVRAMARSSAVAIARYNFPNYISIGRRISGAHSESEAS